VATVAVNAFQFREPVLVGDVVTFFSEIVRTGRTSITVDVEVYATRNPREELTVKVTEATLTYVAVGSDRRPRELPAQ
jgi:acyl-CoA thioesterase YciA